MRITIELDTEVRLLCTMYTKGENIIDFGRNMSVHSILLIICLISLRVVINSI